MKKVNLVMVAHAETTEGPKYTYLNMARYESYADSEEQEDMWVDSVSSDVFEVESYGVQRTEKVSRGFRGGGLQEANLQVKADRSDRPPRRNDFEKGRVSKGAVHQNVGGNMMRMRDRSQGTVPINIHQNIFDLKNDDDLVLMVVDEVGRDNK